MGTERIRSSLPPQPTEQETINACLASPSPSSQARLCDSPSRAPSLQGGRRRLFLNRSYSGEIKEKFAEEVTFGLGLTTWLEFPLAEGVIESDGSSSPGSAQSHPLVGYLSASVALSGKWR